MATSDNAAGLQRRTLLTGAVAALGLARPAAALGADLVDLAVVDRETGAPLRVWRHRGRAYVAGRPGARYGLRVTNRSGGRVLAVMSVDGINVLTGETAGYDQRGYVFGPYESYDVSGWRKSDTEVAAFTFAALRNSYAARTGRPADVGVIGVAVFRERPAPAPEPAYPAAQAEDRNTVEEAVVTGSRRAAPAPPPAAAARARPQERLGTGHGVREWSTVTAVSFERATAYPELTRQIAYDSYENLAALGVIPRPPVRDRPPRPFPASGYVPDPPGGGLP